MRTPLFAALTLIGLIACEREAEDSPRARAPDEGKRVAVSPASPPPAPARAKCPAASFEAFFAVFAEDTTVQKAWSASRLERSRLVDADPEPRLVPDARPVALPLIPSDSARTASGLEIRFDPVAKGVHPAALFKPDTDWLVYYLFSPEGDCWRLVGIEEWAL